MCIVHVPNCLAHRLALWMFCGLSCYMLALWMFCGFSCCRSSVPYNVYHQLPICSGKWSLSVSAVWPICWNVATFGHWIFWGHLCGLGLWNKEVWCDFCSFTCLEFSTWSILVLSFFPSFEQILVRSDSQSSPLPCQIMVDHVVFNWSSCNVCYFCCECHQSDHSSSGVYCLQPCQCKLWCVSAVWNLCSEYKQLQADKRNESSVGKF